MFFTATITNLDIAQQTQRTTDQTTMQKPMASPIHLPTQTFASCRAVVFPTRRAFAAHPVSFVIGSALPFAVASAVVFQALVHV